MDQPRQLLRNVRELIELDIAAGIHYQGLGEQLETISTDESGQTNPAHANATSAGSTTSATSVLSIPAAWGEPDFAGDASERLQTVVKQVASCTRCDLCHGRQHTVPGEGNPQATVMFIGEGPGADEDAQGRPFVGAAGQLLDRMIQAMGLKRDQVFIANVVKCRPPGNRNPEASEILTCGHYLAEQIAAIAPKVICTLGNIPLRALSGEESPGITRRRGNLFYYRDIAVIPTFHPSYLLRNAGAKKPAWDDLQLVLKTAGLKIPAKK